MENIYLIIKGRYSDWNILYATIDETAARNFVDKYNERTDSYGQVYIIEKPIYIPDVYNEDYFGTILEIDFNSKYESRGYIYTNCEIVSSKEYIWDSILSNKENFNTLMQNRFLIAKNKNDLYTYYFLYNKNDDEIDEEETQKLLKIAKDNLMQYLAEKEGL